MAAAELEKCSKVGCEPVLWMMCPLDVDWEATKYTIRCDVCGLRTARVTSLGAATVLWNNKLRRIHPVQEADGKVGPDDHRLEYRNALDRDNP